MKTQAILILICLSVMVGCEHLGCKEIKVGDARSPDGILVATTLTRDCGATTAFSTSINLHRADHGTSEEGSDIIVIGGLHKLDVNWIDADHLAIRCESCRGQQISKMVVRLGKANVKYDIPDVPGN